MSEFIHGTTYYHYAHPADELAEDFAKMRAMGLNTVRVAEIWPGWEVLEPEPGVFDFASLDDYVTKANDAGLGVVMGVGINNPPFWIFTDIPPVRCVDVAGNVATRRVQSANHDHPEYRKYMARFIERHVEHYSKLPGIIAWQFGNEMRYGADSGDKEPTRVRFRQWLRDTYDGDLDELNRQWAVHYRNWDEIYPYTSPAGAPTQGLSPLAIHSRKFQAWSLEELYAWGASIIRRHSDLPIFHNNYGISGPSGSHWRLSRACDLIVHDIYPSMSPNPRVYCAFLLDCAVSIARSRRKDLWIGETSIGQYGTFQRNRVSPRLIETLLAEMIGCGIKGLLYFRHKAPKYEQPHKFTGSQSVLRRDGSAMEYIRSCENMTTLMDRLGSRIMACTPVQPQVAVYYPEESLLFSKDAGYGEIQQAAMFGASGLWHAAHMPIHVMCTDELVNADLNQFRLVYLPVTYLLPEEVGRRLKRYVHDGGTLVAECRCAYVDDLGWLYGQQPGAGLAEVFAASEDLFWNGAMEVEISLQGKTLRLAVPSLCQTYRPDGATVIARNSQAEPVGVLNHYGTGMGIMFGFAPSLLFPAAGGKYDPTSSTATDDRRVQTVAVELIKSLAAEAHVETPLPLDIDSSTVTVRYLRSASEYIVFCCNHGPAVDIPLPTGAEILARNSGDNVSFAGETGPVHLPRFSWLAFSCPL